MNKFLLFVVLSIFFKSLPYIMSNLGFDISSYPWSVTPILALCLFCGNLSLMTLPAIVMAISVITIGLLQSDIRYAIYDGQLFNYSLLFLLTYIGKNITQHNLLLNSTIISMLFFIFSNLNVWYISNMYEHSISGLMLCFYCALPFFANLLLSTIFVSYMFFGVTISVENGIPCRHN